MKIKFDCSMHKRRIFIISVVLVVMVIVFTIILGHQENSDEYIVKHRLQWWLDDIGWDTNRNELTGQGVTIAIIDTGVDFSHNDLSKCRYEEYSIIEHTKENDTNHGTAIAGIISAYPHNDKGVLGIAPNTKIISIDVTDDENVEIGNLVKGIELAISKNVDIINISVGVHKDEDALHECVRKAYEKGIVIVSSAGNYMEDDILYPAKYDEVLAIGAYDKKREIVSPKGDIRDVIYMPGDSIVTCLDGNEYAGVEGTSFSSAIFTGILSLLIEAHPDINVMDINALEKKLYEIQEDSKITVDVIFKEVKE